MKRSMKSQLSERDKLILEGYTYDKAREIAHRCAQVSGPKFDDKLRNMSGVFSKW